MMTRFPVFVRLIPMVMVMGIIFFLSHQTGDQLEVPDLPFIDKIAHFVAYAVLAGTILVVPSQKFKQSRPLLTIVLTVSLCFIYGTGDEFHQSFIPGRFVSAADVLADTMGALCVSLFWLKRHTNPPAPQR
jgi:VanZ family protein